MKLLIIGDTHYSQNSSIIRGQNELLSERLEMCNKAIHWAENLAEEKKVDAIIHLGDFFDTPTLNAMEITAFSKIKWSNLPHIVIMGNHEMGRNDLQLGSAHLFNLLPNFTLITQPTNLGDILGDNYKDILCLPYMLEPTLASHKDEKIIFSHNDIKGINLGGYVTQHGLALEDINTFFVNGHIHNGAELKKNVFNLGNFVGQNFGEDAFKYKHQVMILDTETLTYELIENPYTYHFYKITKLSELDKVKENAIISVTTKEPKKFKEKIAKNKNILYARVLTEVEMKEVGTQKVDLSIDHNELFKNYIEETLGENGLLELEKM